MSNFILTSTLSIFIWTSLLAVAGVLDKRDLIEAAEYWNNVREKGFEYADMERIRDQQNKPRSTP